MPQINFQYSSNVKIIKIKNILEKINHLLTKELPTSLTSCKNRVTQFDNYLVGDTNLSNMAFVHLNIAVMPGRTIELLNKISNDLLKLLYENLSNDNDDLTLDISVEIRNLSDHYAKLVKIKSLKDVLKV